MSDLRPMSENARAGPAESVVEAVGDAAATVKPLLRGWLHAGTAPIAFVCGLVLVALSGPGERLASAVYAVSVTGLFTTSALYHRGRWSARTRYVFERLDHSMIFVLIAGSYTPLAAVVLEGAARTALLTVVWAGAALGITLRLFFRHLPRWLFVLLYLALGWAGLFAMPAIHSEGGVAVLVLVIVGGALYSLGAVVYATQRPDPSPRWFGFHEVFHVFTIAAFAVHYIAVSLAVYTNVT